MAIGSALYQFWHFYGSDIQNGAVVLSAIAAFAVIRSARINSRKRNTLDLILHQESDRELIEARQAFNEIKAGDIRAATYGRSDQKNTPQAQVIRKILNLHELTAVAINEGVIDEAVYRRWFNKTYIDDYDAMRGYIEQARITYQNPHAFKEFQHLALEWQSDTSWYADQGWFARKIKGLKLAWRA
jgi:hypothetical protein